MWYSYVFSFFLHKNISHKNLILKFVIVKKVKKYLLWRDHARSGQ